MSSLVNAQNFLPEPRISNSPLVNNVIDAAASIGESAVGAASGDLMLGKFEELLQVQIKAQEEMQSTNMVSNLERSRHESKMAPIRNIRLS